MKKYIPMIIPLILIYPIYYVLSSLFYLAENNFLKYAIYISTTYNLILLAINKEKGKKVWIYVIFNIVFIYILYKISTMSNVKTAFIHSLFTILTYLFWRILEIKKTKKEGKHEFLVFIIIGVVVPLMVYMLVGFILPQILSTNILFVITILVYYIFAIIWPVVTIYITNYSGLKLIISLLIVMTVSFFTLFNSVNLVIYIIFPPLLAIVSERLKKKKSVELPEEITE